METFPYKKLVVIGTTSSGKSTLAEQLADKLGLDFIELDALNWGPNWTAAGGTGGRQLQQDTPGHLGAR